MTEEQTPLIQYEEMLQAGMHFGRKRTVFNPKMGQYVFSVRDGICLIDLLKTQEALQAAISALNTTLQGGGLVLFVATSSRRSVGTGGRRRPCRLSWLLAEAAMFQDINGRVKRLVQLEEEKATGAWEKYTKKEQLELTRELAEMSRNFAGLKKLTRMPDMVFVASVKEGALAIHEARKMGVKIIAIANTDANPAGLQQVIPANDRSKKAIDLIVNAITVNLNTQAPELAEAVQK